MANIFSKMFSNKEKQQTGNAVYGGFDLLKKIIAPELMTADHLSTYRKSLYVFACVSKIAEKVGSVELQQYQILNSKGDTKQVQVSQLLNLLYKPNQFQVWSDFAETMIINLKCSGDAFIYKVRNNSGRPVELWNLRPDMMQVITDPEEFIKEYRFTRPNDGQQISIAPEDIIHIKYPDPLSEYLGMTPLRPATYSVQTEEYASRYQRDFFLNNARPDAILKTTRNLNPKQKRGIKKGWNRLYKGIGKSSKVAILEGGLDYQQISITQKEMDYIESKKMTRDDILVAFKTPKTVVAITDDVNYANAKTGMDIFLRETIVPEVKRIVSKLTEELARVDFGDDMYIWYENPVPEDRDMVIKEYQSGLQNNYMLINEVRMAEGKPPVKGGWSFYMPIMNQAAGGLPQAETGKSLKMKIGNERDARENEKTIRESLEKKKEIKYDFRGDYWLYQKLLLKEQMTKAMTDMMMKRIKSKKKSKKAKKGKKKGIGRSFITDPEQKKIYAEAQIKKIDSKSVVLKTALDNFFGEQRERVISKINETGKGIIRMKASEAVSKVFDDAKEMDLSINFIVPYIEEFLKESGQESLLSIAPQETFNMQASAIKKFINQRAKEFATSVNDTTLQGLESTLSEGISSGEKTSQLVDRVNEVYSDFPMYRSELIARTESAAANNEGLLQSFDQSGVMNGKEWIAVLDDRTDEDCKDTDGEIVLIHEKFSNGSMYPPLHPNCRCVLGGAFIE